MTTIQSLMLSVCFGAVMGTLTANMIFIIRFAIDTHKDKKRKRKEKEASADKAE